VLRLLSEHRIERAQIAEKAATLRPSPCRKQHA
jgi:hypothetical protein